ncbi:rCG36342, partial [Rattus norvegicus]
LWLLRRCSQPLKVFLISVWKRNT